MFFLFVILFYVSNCCAMHKDHVNSGTIGLVFQLDQVISLAFKQNKYYDDELCLSPGMQDKIVQIIEQHSQSYVINKSDFTQAYVASYRFSNSDREYIVGKFSDPKTSDISNDSNVEVIEDTSYYHQGSFESDSSMQEHSNKSTPQTPRRKTVSFDHA